jgi:hypothetical protein
MNRLQSFLDLAAGAPPERDGRHFRTWQRVSIQVQREVRWLAVKKFSAANLDRAFTMVVYSSCHPSYGQRPMEFTYDLGDPATIPMALRLIGRSLQARLTQISVRFEEDARMRRRFAPVWHVDILNAVKKKPRLLIELLAREATMINALIDLGTMRDERMTKRFLKSTLAAARVLGVDSDTLLDLVLRTGVENLGHGRILENDDAAAAGSPDAGIGGNEDRDHGSPDGCGQVADAGIVPDVHACG